MKTEHIPNGTAQLRFWCKVEKTSSCWMWKGGTTGRYGTFSLCGGEKIGAHVAAYILEKGPIDGDYDVAHTCDNPLCVNPTHLRLMSHKENMLDSIRKCRHPTLGKKHADNVNAKLTVDIVRRIKAARDTDTYHNLAARFGISRSTIRDIFTGKTWVGV